MKSNKKRVFIDLFAGCGGLSLGLEMAGFTPILVNEINKDAMETYLINRDEDFPLLREKYNVADVWSLVDNEKTLKALIRSMDEDYGINLENGDLDLLVGGPPCQGYSGIGHRRHYSVDKEEIPSNHLYKAMAVLIQKLKPKIFLFENVKGLLSGRWTSQGEKGEIWKDILSTYSKIDNYIVRWKLIRAKDYGVPQNRPRILMVGIRKDIIDGETKSISNDAVESGFLPKPSYDYPDLIDLLDDLDNVNYLLGGEDVRYTKTARIPVQKALRTKRNGTLMRKGSLLTEQQYPKHSGKIVDKFTYMHENNGTIPEKYKTKKFAQRLVPARWGKSGPSITVCCLADDYVHYSEPRTFTVREWARLQTFPDWYQFSGKRTTGGIRRAGNPREGIYDRELPKYTQIGNAVPVELAKRIGQNFMRILDENDA